MEALQRLVLLRLGALAHERDKVRRVGVHQADRLQDRLHLLDRLGAHGRLEVVGARQDLGDLGALEASLAGEEFEP